MYLSMKRREKAKAELPEAVRDYFREVGRKAWNGVSAKEKKARASHAARARWQTMTPEERSAEMKRRAAIRKRNAKSKNAADSAGSRSGA